jgi:hypothetical protein
MPKLGILPTECIPAARVILSIKNSKFPEQYQLAGRGTKSTVFSVR